MKDLINNKRRNIYIRYFSLIASHLMIIIILLIIYFAGIKQLFILIIIFSIALFLLSIVYISTLKFYVYKISLSENKITLYYYRWNKLKTDIFDLTEIDIKFMTYTGLRSASKKIQIKNNKQIILEILPELGGILKTFWSVEIIEALYKQLIEYKNNPLNNIEN